MMDYHYCINNYIYNYNRKFGRISATQYVSVDPRNVLLSIIHSMILINVITVIKCHYDRYTTYWYNYFSNKLNYIHNGSYS